MPKERTREATAAGVAMGALLWGKRSEVDFAHTSKKKKSTHYPVLSPFLLPVKGRRLDLDLPSAELF